jgi:nitrate reductase NapAB chaperone NapD
MPIFSYLAYPVKDALEDLRDDLSALSHCEVIPADREQVLILLTDTPDEKEEKQLQNKLKKLSSLEFLGLTFGHADE